MEVCCLLSAVVSSTACCLFCIVCVVVLVVRALSRMARGMACRMGGPWCVPLWPERPWLAKSVKSCHCHCWAFADIGNERSEVVVGVDGFVVRAVDQMYLECDDSYTYVDHHRRQMTNASSRSYMRLFPKLPMFAIASCCLALAWLSGNSMHCM